jgi:hypothetical protein
MNAIISTLTSPSTALFTQAEAGGLRHDFSSSRKASAIPPRRHLAVCSMFALFACAYVTIDRLPGSAASILRGGVGFVARSEISQMTDQVF